MEFDTVQMRLASAEISSASTSEMAPSKTATTAMWARRLAGAGALSPVTSTSKRHFGRWRLAITARQLTAKQPATASSKCSTGHTFSIVPTAVWVRGSPPQTNCSGSCPSEIALTDQRFVTGVAIAKLCSC